MVIQSKAFFKGDRFFNGFLNVILFLLSIIIVFPLWNIIVNSLSSAQAIAEGKNVFWTSDFTLDNYRLVLKDSTIWTAFGISFFKTLFGIFLHVLLCAMVAYGMSKRDLKGRKLYTAMGIITMFFSGGIIPTYILIKSLGMLNTFWVYIIPVMFSYYDMIILMNFFRQVPVSLEESARIDGAGVWRTFLSIILPLSKPALALITLYHGVFQWNDFLTAKLYVTNEVLYPLQMKLYEIIVQQEFSSTFNPAGAVLTTTSKGIQLATIVVTTLPIVIVYPFLQKFFVSGVMLGAVKE